MKVSAWLPVLILVTVILAAGASWYLSSPDRQYLFDREKGISRPWVAEWWAVKIPVAFAAGVIASATLIELLRCGRRQAWRSLVATATVAALSIAVFTMTMLIVQQQVKDEPPSWVRPTPKYPHQVFLNTQWLVLSITPRSGTISQPGNLLGPLRDSGIGLVEYPGYIPFDPFLLKRVTFAGLTADEVESLLGPPSPSQYPESPTMRYHMHGFPHAYQSATLTLSFGKVWEPSDTVLGEHLRQHLPTICPALPSASQELRSDPG